MTSLPVLPGTPLAVLIPRVLVRPVRQLARRYGLGLQTTHRVVRHVPIQLPNPWHRARLPEDGPLPPLAVHRYLVR